MIIADTSGLLTLFNRREPLHETVAHIVTSTREPLVISPFVIAELDYLVATQLGTEASLAVLHELASRAYELAAISVDELAACAQLVDTYRDQDIGVTDASLVVLAHRYNTQTILTLDRRHFDVLRPTNGGRFDIVPDWPT